MTRIRGARLRPGAVLLLLFVAATMQIASADYSSSAQSRPPIAGKWTLAPLAQNAVGGAGASGRPAPGRDDGGAKPICGAEFSLALEDTSVTVTRPLGDKPLTLRLPIGGETQTHTAPLCRVLSPAMQRESELMYRAAARDGVSLDMTSTAAWSGSELMLRSMFRSGAARREIVQRLTFSAPDTLIVETTIAAGDPPAPGPPQRLVYRRAPRSASPTAYR